ncbi:MAG TPA: alpha-L-fucosidase, partial [Niabella sp.]|nr:alpha-L-fucosidase [Niabella sp.]
MKDFYFKKILLMLLWLMIYLPSNSQSTKPYEPTWESVGNHNPVPEWIRDAKFGIYCHWGVY